MTDEQTAREIVRKIICNDNPVLWERYAGCPEEVALVAAALAQERERCAKVCEEKSANIANSFINCDEINAYRLACEYIAAAIRRHP